MKWSNATPPANRAEDGEPTGGSMPKFSLGLVCYILFRHKWLILGLTALGIGAAFVTRELLVVPYVSQARILIRYVEDRQSPTASEDVRRRSIDDRGGMNIIRTEVEILSSYDLALEVAREMGPANILAELTGDSEKDLSRAAGAIFGGLQVTPRSAVLSVEYRNADSTRVQPILAGIIDTYRKRHVKVHRSMGDINQLLIQETDTRREPLQQTEEELRKLLEQAGVVDLASASTSFAERTARIQQDLLEVESELAERKALLAIYQGASPQAAEGGEQASIEVTPTPIPEETQAAYRQATSLIPVLRGREQELLLQFTSESPMVKGVRTRLAEQEAIKARIEKDYPQLVSQSRAAATSGATTATGTTSPAFDPSIESARITAIEVRRRILNDQLARLRADMARIGTLETQITELQRTRELQEQQYKYLSTNLERARVDEAFGPNRVSNISVIESPTPPLRDNKKTRPILLGLALGGGVLGLALAAAIELFLDQSIRRSSDLENAVGLPLMLSIPRTPKSALAALPSAGHRPPELTAGPTRGGGAGQTDSAAALAPRTRGALDDYFDALRNRIVYSFEMRGITRKPKLVAVTSASPDSGVSTIASGLASSLSETGDGNVLLVDLNPDRKSTQHFHRGDLKVGIGDALEQERRDDALVRENLYLVSTTSEEDQHTWFMPKRFASLVPKLKASDYDYIIFDLPPVSQISATPQIARFMDQVLMVVESEKTSRDSARRAGSMLTEAGANVAVVLNKTRTYVPASLTSEAVDSA